MMNSQAANASPRWLLATATSTIGSPTLSAPMRWITVQSITCQRDIASRVIFPSAFSVIPG